MNSIQRHRIEIQQNLERLWAKPLLKRIYHQFYRRIAAYLPAGVGGEIVELGSGAPDVTDVIPHCLRTDIFPNPWIDRIENAYRLSFTDQSVSGLILMDVFHHLRYPGTALEEFQRVLTAGGRVIILDPGLSLLGWFAYGLLHPEPLGLKEDISWVAPEGWSPDRIDYYAAQGNAHRVFIRGEGNLSKSVWRLVAVKRYADISYVASGGYSKPQLYPDSFYPVMRSVDKFCDVFPGFFTTRLLVVLEKVEDEPFE
jgi:hypothetical protein